MGECATRACCLTGVSPRRCPADGAGCCGSGTSACSGPGESEVGNSITIVVIPLVAIDTLHTSTFIVTLLTAMMWLPWVIIGIPAGAWVDRLPPRPVMLASDAISAAVYASVPVAAWCGVLTVAQLIAVTLIAGAASVFFNSAYQVLLPGVVDEANLTEGNAKLLGSREVAQIGGPGLGGLLALGSLVC